MKADGSKYRRLFRSDPPGFKSRFLLKDKKTTESIKNQLGYNR